MKIYEGLQASGKNGNFGDELNKFIIGELINKEKYDMGTNLHLRQQGQGNHKGNTQKTQKIDYNLVGIGSYMEGAINDSYIYGTGTLASKPKNPKLGYAKNLKIFAVRGPKTFEQLKDLGYFESNSIESMPPVFGDPALLIRKFYQPKNLPDLYDKICFLPHYVHNSKYSNENPNQNKNQTSFTLPENFHKINALNHWTKVVDSIYNCKLGTISSSLHGLIISDAYNRPNLWLSEYKIRSNDNDWKFLDYFESQGRVDEIKLENINNFNENMFYRDGNRIDLDVLERAFPFK